MQSNFIEKVKTASGLSRVEILGEAMISTLWTPETISYKIKSIPLTGYGDDVISQWEQECDRIRLENEEIKKDAKPHPIIGWECFEIFENLGETSSTSHWVEDEDSARRVFGADFDFNSLPIEKECNLYGRISSFTGRPRPYLVKPSTRVEEIIGEMREFPSRPDVQILTHHRAVEEIQKFDPSFDLGQYMKLTRVESGYQGRKLTKICTSVGFQMEYPCYRTFNTPLRRTGSIYMSLIHLIYQIYPDRLEIWVNEYTTTTSSPSSGGCSVSENDYGIGAEDGFGSL